MTIPITSMYGRYGIFSYICLNFVLNVGKCTISTIHGWYGIWKLPHFGNIPGLMRVRYLQSARVNNERTKASLFFMLIQHHNSYTYIFIYLYINPHTVYDIYLFRVYVGKLC